MENVLVIGAGGVGGAVTHKCAQNNDILGNICLASRTVSKCEAIVESVHRKGNLKDPSRSLFPRALQAKDPHAIAGLIRETRSSIVINVAAPFCNLAIIEACLATGAHYIDTAVYEREDVINERAPWYENYEWKYRDQFEARGITAVLGIGFDPGVVNVFSAYVYRHLIDTIDSIDIMDVNAGDHGRFFATNFDPEVNLREILEDVIYWEDGEFRSIPCHSRSRTYDFPVVGEHEVYSMGHDELHSLPFHIPARRIEFWMGFGEQYLNCFNVLNQIGMLSHEPVNVRGTEVIPLQLLRAVLPEPASLAPDYKGQTCIGCLIKGTHQDEPRELFIYNICDHEACYGEVESQAISYTTAVPAVAAARLIATGEWNTGTMMNAEQFDPDPFLQLLPDMGLPWHIRKHK